MSTEPCRLHEELIAGERLVNPHLHPTVCFAKVLGGNSLVVTLGLPKSLLCEERSPCSVFLLPVSTDCPSSLQRQQSSLLVRREARLDCTFSSAPFQENFQNLPRSFGKEEDQSFFALA